METDNLTETKIETEGERYVYNMYNLYLIVYK